LLPDASFDGDEKLKESEDVLRAIQQEISDAEAQETMLKMGSNFLQADLNSIMKSHTEARTRIARSLFHYENNYRTLLKSVADEKAVAQIQTSVLKSELQSTKMENKKLKMQIKSIKSKFDTLDFVERRQDEIIGAQGDTADAQDETVEAQDEVVNDKNTTIGAQDKTIGAQDKTIGAQDKTIGAQDKTDGKQDVIIDNLKETTGAQDELKDLNPMVKKSSMITKTYKKVQKIAKRASSFNHT